MLLSAVGFTEQCSPGCCCSWMGTWERFCSQSWDFWPDIPTVERKLHHTPGHEMCKNTHLPSQLPRLGQTPLTWRGGVLFSECC